MNKKVLSKVILAFAALLLTTSAFAISREPCDTKEVCCEDPAPGPFAFSYPRDMGLACPRDFYAHGEFMWMKPSEEGLEYAMDQDDTTQSTTIFPLQNGTVKGFSSGSQEWDWRPGFRVGFGFYSNYDSWNLDVNWTYLRMKADANADNGATGVLLPLFLPPLAAVTRPNYTSASSRWSGDYNTMDIMIGKPYHVSRYFTSNPQFGIRAGWIDQDYHVRYFDANLSKQNVFLKNDFWGVGLRGYYEGNFLLGSGWYIYGKAAFSLLYGKFDISQNCENNNSLQEYKLEDSFYSVQPNAELGMGFSWGKYMNKGQYLVSVKVGYEFHHWWDQNQARRFFDTDPTANDTVSRGDLSFNGFLFGLALDF